MAETRRYKVEVTEEPRTTMRTLLIKRILDGDYDEDLEDILEAAHHRKRELRDKRYGR